MGASGLQRLFKSTPTTERAGSKTRQSFRECNGTQNLPNATITTDSTNAVVRLISPETMKICALLTALLTVTPLVAGDCYSGTDECCLCGGCCSPKNPSTYVGQQLTCSQVDLEYTFNLKYAPMSSSSCASMISKYRTTCCSTTSPTDVYQQPTQSSNNLPQGSYSTCDLCWKTGDQPTKPYTVLAILGIPGNPTCQIAYEMGQNGLIPDNLCYPLQVRPWKEMTPFASKISHTHVTSLGLCARTLWMPPALDGLLGKQLCSRYYYHH